MTTTDVLAWWGAVLATIVFAWDIYKWKTAGAKLSLSVQAGMRGFNTPEFGDSDLIVASVANVGDRATTITHMAMLHYPNFLSWLRGKPAATFLIPQPSTVNPTPYMLAPGGTWLGVGLQDSNTEQMAKNGRLYCHIYHSVSSRPVKARVKIAAG